MVFDLRKNKLGLPYIDIFGNNPSGEYVPIEKKVIVGAGTVNFKDIGLKMFGIPGFKSASPQAVKAGFPWVVAGGGAILGAGTAFFLGKKGQEQAVAQAVDQKLDQKQDLTAALKPSYNVGGDWQPANDLRTYNQYDIISGGTGSIYSEKKIEAQGGQTPAWSMPNIISQVPSQAGSQGASQGAEQGQTAGTDMIWLVAIAAVGIVGYGYFSGRKKHEKTK